MKTLISVTFTLLITLMNNFADTNHYSTVKIKSIETWNSGKVYFKFENYTPTRPPGCNSNSDYRLNALTAQALNSMLSIALTANSTGSTLTVGVDDTECDNSNPLINSLEIE